MAVTPNSVVTTQNTKTAFAVCTAAKTTYNDITNAVLLATIGANGGLLKKLWALPRATVTITELQLIIDVGGAGTTFQFVDAASMAAHTKVQTAAPTKTDFGYSQSDPLLLGPGDKLYVGAGVALAGGIVFTAQYEEF